MSPLLEAAFSDSNLLNAWHRVKENDGVAGVDGQSIAAFAEGLLGRIMELQRIVREGEYRPSPLLRVWMERPGKSPRGLAIPTVTDRLLQTAVSLVIGPVLDRHFEDCSFAYRPAHSIHMALAKVVEHRDAGYMWVVDADIYHFFDEIAHLRLLHKVKAILDDFELIHWIARWMRAPIQDAHGQSIPRKGIAQGSPLSPLLANLYLDELDKNCSRPAIASSATPMISLYSVRIVARQSARYISVRMCCISSNSGYSQIKLTSPTFMKAFTSWAPIFSMTPYSRRR